MDLQFYNTLTKRKDLFKPINPEEIRIYSCGPTVYKDATIGNMRTNIFQDVLRRVLVYNGYKLKHVMNITDVGHLVSDGDNGEDKMQKASEREHKSPYEIANYYTKAFLKDLEKLNIKKEEVIAIGDNVNDKKMVENAGLGIAMGGSTPNLTSVADFITKTSDEDGVAYALNKFLN